MEKLGLHRKDGSSSIPMDPLTKHTTREAGVVIWDSDGAVFLAACTPLHDCRDAEEADDNAALFGVKLIYRLPTARVIVELNFSSSVSALQTEELWVTNEEIKSLIKNLEVCC
jgi:hypothetical protein